MVEQAELQVLVEQPVVHLARLVRMASTVMEAMQVTAEPEELVQRELMERRYPVMAEPAESAEQEGAEA